MNTNSAEQDYQMYCQLIRLWAKENPIKTGKLQMLLLVNGLIIIAVTLNGGTVGRNWPLYCAGAFMSLIWTLSIGRTSLFQKIWQNKIEKLAQRHPEDKRFHVLQNSEAKAAAPALLQIIGGVSSKYYLLGAPLAFCIWWLVLFLVSV